MPRIEHIVGEGPELAESQRKVLDLLEKHPDFLFRMQTEDLWEIKEWLIQPNNPEPPATGGVRRDSVGSYSVGTIKWALSTLHARGKIGSDKWHRRTYYGSQEAIARAKEFSPEGQSLRRMAELKALGRKARQALDREAESGD